MTKSAPVARALPGTTLFRALPLLTIVTGCQPPPPSVGEAESAITSNLANDHQFANTLGTVATYSPNGNIDLTGPFFQSLGTNGRSCFSCHQYDQGWSISPATVQSRFNSSNGTDPIFAKVDGSNSPLADVSTLAAKQTAYSMLLNKGLIRVGLPIPGNAEFTLSAVDDPYQYASASELSLFRRPLPAANLGFLTAVMWDGRETQAGATIDADLLQQANDATMGHAQASAPLTAAQARAIVDFEMQLFTAQYSDNNAKSLAAKGSNGGAATPSSFLATEPFHIGINDLLGDSQTGASFNPVVFTLYDAWATSLTGTGQKEEAQRAILRGQTVFNTKSFAITGVAGVNDNPSFNAPASLQGTCTTCHDTPNVGNHSVALPLDIGLVDVARRTADMPLYTLTNKATGQTRQVTDPGRALVTGKWADIGKFKGPILRGLASRPPYFHNGSAATLGDVINFYNVRFAIGFTAQESSDLLAFLQSL